MPAAERPELTVTTAHWAGLQATCPTFYPPFMKKTSIYLEDHQVERLKQLSEAEGRSQAEIVRHAITLYRSPSNQPPRKFAMEGVAPGLAQRLGYRSIMDIPEEELLEGFGE